MFIIFGKQGPATSKRFNFLPGWLDLRDRSLVARSTDCCVGERSGDSAARLADRANRSHAGNMDHARNGENVGQRCAYPQI